VARSNVGSSELRKPEPLAASCTAINMLVLDTRRDADGSTDNKPAYRNGTHATTACVDGRAYFTRRRGTVRLIEKPFVR